MLTEKGLNSFRQYQLFDLVEAFHAGLQVKEEIALPQKRAKQ